LINLLLIFLPMLLQCGPRVVLLDDALGAEVVDTLPPTPLPTQPLPAPPRLRQYPKMWVPTQLSRERAARVATLTLEFGERFPAVGNTTTGRRSVGGNDPPPEPARAAAGGLPQPGLPVASDDDEDVRKFGDAWTSSKNLVVEKVDATVAAAAARGPAVLRWIRGIASE
jgi:hypothetical protein